MNTDAADSFVSWLGEHEEDLAQKHRDMLDIIDANGSPQEAAGLFQELEQEIAPRLLAIADGISFELGPGEEKERGFILCAGGISKHIPLIKDLSARLQGLNHWDVIAFKPPRPLTAETVQVYMFHDGERRVSPADIQVALTPGLSRIAISLYFDGYQDEDYEAWGQVGFNFLDFSLGEYAVMESVGELSFGHLRDAPDTSIALTDLYTTFQHTRTQIQERYQHYCDASKAEQLSMTLEQLEDQLTALQQQIESHTHSDDLFIDMVLWGPGGDVRSALNQKAPAATIEADSRLSLHGEGTEYLIQAELPKSSFSATEWIQTMLNAVESPLIATAIYLQEAPEPALAQFAASSMLENGDIDGAIRFLKMTTRLLGSKDDGILHTLLGHAYLQSSQLAEARDTYDVVLSLTDDPAIRGEVLSNKGSALQQLGALDDALTCFKQALELDDSLYNRHYNLGQAYAQTGDTAQACTHLRKALNLHPAIRSHIESDSDLDAIRDSEQFQEMLETCGQSESLKDSLMKGFKSFFTSDKESS